MSDTEDENIPSAADCERRCQSFADITGTDTALAMFYLQDRNWNVEVSVNAFFEDQDVTDHDKGTKRGGSDVTESGGSSKQMKIEKHIEDPEPQRIRLLSWNIDGLDKPSAEKRTTEICNIIKKENPHAILLQEVTNDTLPILQQNCPSYKIIPGGSIEYFTAIMLKNDFVKFFAKEIQPFKNTVMMRNLLAVQCQIKGIPFTLMTSHLESTKEYGEERKQQLKQCFEAVKAAPPTQNVIFGGDLNMRDKELKEVGGIPSGVCDVWEATGSRKECLYTWDMMRNTNLVFDKFKPRCRFDRLYLRHSNPTTIKPVYFELIGLEKVKSCGKFPSDHWGLLSHYDILNKT
ncbi:tyrosyl-DNA phosphodiesterase 2-like [Saccostrea cucullata]|uniref:tyrosyl-DNA phosphodiesterase 2-like n=1 Tax=Saccostrea cuccullata TaxID=36930 RepID=UPI002ED667CB